MRTRTERDGDGRNKVKTVSRIRGTALAVGLFLLSAAPPPAHSIYGGKGATQENAAANPTRVTLHDRTLVDQDGKPVRFPRDVIGDRVAVISTFFTSCGQICPILSAILKALQDELGSRLGKEVVLVSISVDPVTDVPPRLKTYARSWNARPGWLFLTGEKRSIDHVLTGLGMYAPDFVNHPAQFLVGVGGAWTRYYGFASPEELLSRIDTLAAERRTPAR